MIVETEQVLEMLQDLDLALKTQMVIANPGLQQVGPSVAEIAATRIELLVQEIEDLKREQQEMEITLKEVEVQKLNLQPDEVLVVKIRSDELTQQNMYQLRTGMSNYFPNNKVLVMGVGEEGSIDLTVAKGSEYPETQYCSDCSCGKKAAFEGEET